jgi:Fic family protein
VSIAPLETLDPARFDRPELLRGVASAARALAELKGVAASIPNSGILLSTLPLQEARDSSAIENIVTTQDDLFQADAYPEGGINPVAKEVVRYGVALRRGFEEVQRTGLLTCRHILTIQGALEQNNAGFRRVPGTVLRDQAGRVIYTPPQDATEVVRLMEGLERFINAHPPFPVDPLVRMALIHHQFESIHPFYDGNGRTGRIVNVLYLVKEGLLDLPILYLSRHIVHTKARYYALLQAVREEDRWEEWVAYMLEAVERTARDALATVQAIRALLQDTKHRIRSRHRFYSQDLLNSLFRHPYTRIRLVEQELGVSRITATRYLDLLAADGILSKQRAGRTVLYINTRLVDILSGISSAGHPAVTS